MQLLQLVALPQGSPDITAMAQVLGQLAADRDCLVRKAAISMLLQLPAELLVKALDASVICAFINHALHAAVGMEPCIASALPAKDARTHSGQQDTALRPPSTLKHGCNQGVVNAAIKGSNQRPGKQVPLMPIHISSAVPPTSNGVNCSRHQARQRSTAIQLDKEDVDSLWALLRQLLDSGKGHRLSAIKHSVLALLKEEGLVVVLPTVTQVLQMQQPSEVLY